MLMRCFGLTGLIVEAAAVLDLRRDSKCRLSQLKTTDNYAPYECVNLDLTGL